MHVFIDGYLAARLFPNGDLQAPTDEERTTILLDQLAQLTKAIKRGSGR